MSPLPGLILLDRHKDSLTQLAFANLLSIFAHAVGAGSAIALGELYPAVSTISSGSSCEY